MRQTDFETFCEEHLVEDREREQLAWFLAMFRAKRLYEALKDKPK